VNQRCRPKPVLIRSTDCPACSTASSAMRRLDRPDHSDTFTRRNNLAYWQVQSVRGETLVSDAADRWRRRCSRVIEHPLLPLIARWADGPIVPWGLPRVWSVVGSTAGSKWGANMRAERPRTAVNDSERIRADLRKWRSAGRRGMAALVLRSRTCRSVCVRNGTWKMPSGRRVGLAGICCSDSCPGTGSSARVHLDQ
jgi:hypothetical protein